MKTRTIFFITTLVILLTACNGVNPATPTPEIFHPVDPSPTPSGSDLPLTCQVTDLSVYINEADGYCFAYPTRFTLGDQPWFPGHTAILGPTVGSSAEPIQALFVVDVTAFDVSLSVDQQVDSFLEGFTTVDQNSMVRTRLIVAGEAAVLVESVPVHLSWRIIFLRHDDKLYRLMYWPVDVQDAYADLEELYQTTLNSFSFLLTK